MQIRQPVTARLKRLTWPQWILVLLPFLWLTLAPAVTILVSSALLELVVQDSSVCTQSATGASYGIYSCSASGVVWTLAPGLLNMLPLLLMLYPNRWVRLAAAVGGGAGAIRLAFPAITYFAATDGVRVSKLYTPFFVAVGGPSNGLGVAVMIIQFAMWIAAPVSLLILGVVGLVKIVGGSPSVARNS